MVKMRTFGFVMVLLAISLIAGLAGVSAYGHSSFSVSDSISYKEDIVGQDRGFTITRSADSPRKTVHGWYDWSANPRGVIRPHPSSYKVSEGLALEAFRTFQQDSRAQTELQFLHEARRGGHFGFAHYPYRYSGFYGGYSPYRYASFSGGYYPRGYGYY